MVLGVSGGDAQHNVYSPICSLVGEGSSFAFDADGGVPKKFALCQIVKHQAQEALAQFAETFASRRASVQASVSHMFAARVVRPSPEVFPPFVASM